MTEQMNRPEQIKPPIFQIGISESRLPPEMHGVITWAKEQMRLLPEMKVRKSPVEDGKTWQTKMTREGKLDLVVSPFFSFEGTDVSTPALNWHQGALIQRHDMLPTIDGKKVPVSGFVILLNDSENRTFITMHQEPLVEAKFIKPNGDPVKKSDGSKEIHPIARTPIQASVEKIKKLTTGVENKAYDESLHKIFSYLTSSRNEALGQTLASIPFVKIPTDGARIKSDVAYGTLSLSPKEAQDIQKLVPDGRWCTEAEIDALSALGLTNGHLHEGLGVQKALKRFGSSK